MKRKAYIACLAKILIGRLPPFLRGEENFSTRMKKLFACLLLCLSLACAAQTSGSANGLGTAARFYFPHGIALDGKGGAWVADTSNHTIRHIDAAGLVRTVAGQAGQRGYADGQGTAARFSQPMQAGKADGQGSAAQFHSPTAIALGADGFSMSPIRITTAFTASARQAKSALLPASPAYLAAKIARLRPPCSTPRAA